MTVLEKKKRKSFFVDEKSIKKAQKLLGAESEGETIRLAIEKAIESEEFIAFLKKTGGKLPKGSFDLP